MAHKIIVIEDEPDIANLLTFHLRSDGYECLVARDGKKGLHLAQTERPDLVLLDLMLPGMSGTDVCKALKGNAEYAHIPVIMLTAKGDEVDRILGFELGADDYVVKPFSPRELMLRIKTVLKHNAHAAPPISHWQREGLEADFSAYTLLVDGQDVRLTPTEFKLFGEFVRNEGKVLSREQLLSNAWGYEFEGYSRTVDTHVRRLRKKLGPYADILETVRGIGYRMQRENRTEQT
jgi:two-component system phosphate regulon response regulator PhoB